MRTTVVKPRSRKYSIVPSQICPGGIPTQYSIGRWPSLPAAVFSVVLTTGAITAVIKSATNSFLLKFTLITTDTPLASPCPGYEAINHLGLVHPRACVGTITLTHYSNMLNNFCLLLVGTFKRGIQRYMLDTMKKRVLTVLAAALMLASVMIAGCSSTAPNNTTPSTSASQTTNATIHTTATQTPTSTVVPTATAMPRVPTSIEGDKEVSLALSSGITRGTGITLGFRVVIVGSSQIQYLCGQAVNFYIDGQPAGGKWAISSPGPVNSCWVTASLTLSPKDTAKLSPGAHTLTVDYTGDTTYAPSQFVSAFNVK
jgi:hypothetical protein